MVPPWHDELRGQNLDDLAVLVAGLAARLGHRPGEVLPRFPTPKDENVIALNVLHFSISFYDGLCSIVVTASSVVQTAWARNA